MPTYFITGANRGLGLEFVRQISSNSANTVLACTRSFNSGANDDLHAFAEKSNGKIHVLECDTSKIASIKAVKGQVEKVIGANGKIDYLLNNAAINATPDQLSLDIDPASMAEHITVNVIGPAKVVEVLSSHLQKGSLVMNMTSGLGSIGRTIGDIGSKCTVYAISKGALNMLAVHQSFNLKDKGVRVVVMDPGWVKTRMGGEGAILEPHESIGGMLKTIHGLGESDTAQFYQYNGGKVPW